MGSVSLTGSLMSPEGSYFLLTIGTSREMFSPHSELSSKWCVLAAISSRTNEYAQSHLMLFMHSESACADQCTNSINLVGISNANLGDIQPVDLRRVLRGEQWQNRFGFT